jgi:uncharacterized protein
MLFTKSDPLLDDLLQIAQNVHDSAVFFNQYKVKSLESVESFSNTMKDFESKGDQLIHEIILRINKSFITAIEREDVMELAIKLDDVLDGLECCAARLYMFDITEGDDVMIQFAKIIEDSTQQIVHALELLQKQKLADMKKYIIGINELESHGDELLRTSVRGLFKNSTDAIQIMQLKEIYELLEEVTDHCEDVADVLETVIMGNT